MARMHSRAKGKSGSVRPVDKKKPTWAKYSNEELEAIIVKLAKSGKRQSEIGMILRDSYGVPDIRLVLGKKIAQVLADNKIAGEVPEDMINLIKKEIELSKHLEDNHKDMPAKREIK